MFAHNHIFWIAGLLLAFIPMPDFSTPLNGMADSLAKMAGWGKGAATSSRSAESALPEQANATAAKQVAAETGSSAIASSSAHFSNGTRAPSKEKA